MAALVPRTRCLDCQFNALSTCLLGPSDNHICLYPLPLHQAALAPALEVSVCKESQKQIARVFLPVDSTVCAPLPADTAGLQPSRCRML